MIGALPTSLEVGDKKYAIDSDFRTALLILEAFNDPELSAYEATEVMLRCLYINYQDIPEKLQNEACEKAVWYLNVGDTTQKPQTTSKPLYSWEQDEQMIFSAVNKVAGKELRTLDYLHYWTFIGYFNEIGEGMFSTVISIRQKKSKGKKLEKWEQDFYKNNKNIVDLKRKRTEEELEALDALDEILKGG